MKKTLSILVLTMFALFSISSCSDRDSNSGTENNTSPKYNIIGKWNVMSFKNENGEYQNMSFLNWYAQFNSDGSYQSFSGETTYYGTYTYDNNDKIEVHVGNETVHCRIISLSGNNAEAEVYYESDPNDKVVYKIKR